MKNRKGFTLSERCESNGFSLIEVLIFVSILSIFFVVAATVTVASLRNMKISEHKILATYYGEELVEWLRDQKESDWTTFAAWSGNYCFDVSPIDSVWPGGGACATSSLGGIFARNLVVTPVGSPVTQVNIKVTVSWDEIGNNYQVPLATIFTRWED